MVANVAQESNAVIAGASDLSAVAQRAKAEAIQDNKKELDCFVATAPRNDVDSSKHNSSFPRRNAPELCR
jgi:hypothetical protein